MIFRCFHIAIVFLLYMVFDSHAQTILTPIQKEQVRGRIQKDIEWVTTTTTKDFRNSFKYYMIASRYDSLNEKANVKYYCRAGILADTIDMSFGKRRLAYLLADQFIEENQFDSALYYIRHVEAMKSFGNRCGSNSLLLRTETAYRLMRAYEGLGQIDAAINSFVRYAFQEWTNAEGTACDTRHDRENDYHCQVSAFLRILEKKYPQSQIENCIKQVAGTIRLQKDPPNEANWVNVRWTINFFDQEIVVQSVFCRQADIENETQWFREYLREHVKRMLICNMVMAPLTAL